MASSAFHTIVSLVIVVTEARWPGRPEDDNAAPEAGLAAGPGSG